MEVYEYSRPPTSNLNPEDGFEDALKDIKSGLQGEVDRKVERRSQTLRDSRNLTRRLALMNFGPGDKFLTLTFAPKKVKDVKCLYSLDYVDNEFKKFIKRFNYKFGVKLKYIAVREAHKSGQLHLHMLCDWNHEFKNQAEIEHYERYLGTDIWKNGWVDIKAIDHVDNIGAYLIKYMTKNIAIDMYKGKKVYLCSKGLKRPMEYGGLEAEAIIKFYELDNKKEVFTNCYESEYLGTITYREYNLKRSMLPV